MRGRTDACSAKPLAERHAKAGIGCVVSTWVWSAANGCHLLDRETAELLTGDSDLADTELPPDVVSQRLLPEDGAMIMAAAERAVG